MSLNTLALINYLAWFPALVGAVYFNRLSSTLRPLVILLILGAINEFILTAVAHLYHNNVPVVYLYTIADIWLSLLFISRVVGMRSSFPIVAVILTASTLTEFSLHPFVFGSVSRLLLSFTIIYSLGRAVWRVSQGNLVIELGEYYVIGVLLLYYTVSLVYFGFAGFTQGEILLFITTIHIIINGFINILLTLALWKCIRSSSLA